jgi:hypothetical protein
MSNINSLNLDIEIAGSGTLYDASNVINPTTEYFVLGSGNTQFPGDIAPELIFSTGTGNLQGNQWYLGQRTLAATSYDLLNLQSGSTTSGLKNGLGQYVQIAQLKWLILAILNHDGVKKLQIGPQGQSNAWPAWFEAVTANFYTVESWLLLKCNEYGTGLGPAITSTTNILPIYNPTANPITYSIFLGGNE